MPPGSSSPGPAKTRAPRLVRARPEGSFAGRGDSPNSRARPPKAARNGPREQARGAFRRAILEAAERVFQRSGFYAVRMADIAKEAGVSVGTLYNYFENKDVVLGEILDALHVEFMDALGSVAVSSDPLERLQGILQGALQSLDEHAALYSIFSERGAVGECDVERLVGPKVSRRYDEFLELMEKTVRECVRQKRIRKDVDPRILTAALAGTMNGAMYRWLKEGRRGRLSEYAGQLFQLFLNGARQA